MLVHRDGVQFGVMLMDEWPVESIATRRVQGHFTLAAPHAS
jgi:hypothetical protein